MKQFIIALRSADFIKSGKSWTTEAIDLYNNKWYTNYSVSRSSYGLNELEDRRFVGSEVIDASPTVLIDGSIPVSVTDYGEIVREENIITYNIFQYDEKTEKYYIFNLNQSSSPYFVLDVDSIDNAFYRFVDTSSKIDILSYKRRVYKHRPTRFSKFYSNCL